MIPALMTTLHERTAEWNLPQVGNWTFLFHNNYHPHYSNINVLWFHERDRFPRLVTKVFREPKLPNREFGNLKQVYACAPLFVPKPLEMTRFAGFWALWMEGVPGSPVRAGNGRTIKVLAPVVEMIASMHNAVRTSDGALDAHRHQRMVVAPLQAVAEFGPSAAVKSGCAKLMTTTSQEWVSSLPVIPQHGDLFLSNVLSTGTDCFVVDWETLGVVDFPFYDLMTLLISFLRSTGDSWDRWDSSLTRSVSSMVELYAQRVGMPLTDVSRLLPLTLANWFYLQWCDGRSEFTAMMYSTIQHYFEHPDVWERVFLGGSRSYRDV